MEAPYSFFCLPRFVFRVQDRWGGVDSDVQEGMRAAHQSMPTNLCAPRRTLIVCSLNDPIVEDGWSFSLAVVPLSSPLCLPVVCVLKGGEPEP
jgi:hypothetical protein